MEYASEDLLRLARRYNNPKRAYLLVNPLQGKHIPVSPAASLGMMESLGRKLAGRYPDARLVIGFAETATAIGAVTAMCFGGRCRYLHTTREEVKGVNRWVNFQEEHSHATNQKLCGDSLARWIEETPRVIFVDDELSTGKTLLNVVGQLRRQFPQLGEKPVAAASILSRLTKEDQARLMGEGIESCCLLTLPNEDYTKIVSQYDIRPAEDLRESERPAAAIEELAVPGLLPNPRTGVVAADYQTACQEMAAQALSQVKSRGLLSGRVLVLGTEECMYPALALGKAFEEAGIASLVRCHATTRSPIGICAQEGYPIWSGEKIHSVYEDGRETYLYDLDAYDVAVMVSDGNGIGARGIVDVARAVYRRGCETLLYVGVGRHV